MCIQQGSHLHLELKYDLCLDLCITPGVNKQSCYLDLARITIRSRRAHYLGAGGRLVYKDGVPQVEESNAMCWRLSFLMHFLRGGGD